jgi:hypothetical protein
MTPEVPIAGQRFLQCFGGYLALLAAFQNVYLYTPQLLAKPPGRSAKPMVGYTVMKSLVYHGQTPCTPLPFPAIFQEIYDN